MYEAYIYNEIKGRYQYQSFWDQKLQQPKTADEKSTLVFGHTHRLGIHRLSDQAGWIRPGSTSYRRPDDPDKSAYCLTIEEGSVYLHRIEYDRSTLRDAVRSTVLKQSELDMAERSFG